jgi:hypothetical protein
MPRIAETLDLAKFLPVDGRPPPADNAIPTPDPAWGSDRRYPAGSVAAGGDEPGTRANHTPLPVSYAVRMACSRSSVRLVRVASSSASRSLSSAG